MSSNLKIIFDNECLKHINLFQSITKASVKDCIIDLDKIMFVVKEGQAGLAIGKNGANIKNLQRLIKKKVEIIEFNNDLKSFLDNIFRPVKVKESVNVDGGNRRVVKVSVENDNHINSKSYVKSKVKKARGLLKRYFNIDDINIV
ncbi:MAG: NusA-like transcription termination signal-binding factor [Candidatus Nanoarchaeia archaeon]|jgi:N utilization substance protein A